MLHRPSTDRHILLKKFCDSCRFKHRAKPSPVFAIQVPRPRADHLLHWHNVMSFVFLPIPSYTLNSPAHMRLLPHFLSLIGDGRAHYALAFDAEYAARLWNKTEETIAAALA